MTAEPTVIAKLAEWLKHSRDGGLHHVSIPCDRVDEILALLRAQEVAPGADDLKRGPNELLTSDSRNPAKNPFIERRWELRKMHGQTEPDVTLEDSLNVAVQAAARDLPDDYVISICVEHGSAWVEVCGGERFEYLPDGAGMTLSEQISECIAKAKEHASPSAAGER